jgi:hypothetical protein
MKKWWIGAALAAMCVGQSAWAQYPPGGPLPEPVPEAACPPGGQQFTPGPLGGANAPPGPGDALSLPADIPTAWGQGYPPESAAYLHLGGMGLIRQRPGRDLIAMDEFHVALTTNNIDPSYQWGGRATFGYLCDDAAIELTGFYLPEQETNVTFADPGRLQLAFFHPPTGFAGLSGHGLWDRADAVTATLKSTLGNAELNYRWWSRAFFDVEGIVGFRYMDLQETAIITASEATSAGRPSPELVGIYSARAHNRLLMPQTGFEWTLPIFKWLSFGLMAKGALGADDYAINTQLNNATGFVGVRGRREDWTWSTVYEANVFLDIVQLEKMRIRAGWTGLWAMHVAEGFQQIDYNLALQPGRRRDSGNIFYQGPLLEVQFLF